MNENIQQDLESMWENANEFVEKFKDMDKAGLSYVSMIEGYRICHMSKKTDGLFIPEGRWFKAKRNQLKLTIEQVFRKTKLATAIIKRIEEGPIKGNIKSYKRLMDFYNNQS